MAAVWAVHPLRAESVVWVVERKDGLAVLFGLLALAAYGRYRQTERVQDYLLMLGPWMLSLLAKPMLMTLPFLLVVVDYWPLEAWRGHGPVGARWRRMVLEKVPLVVLALVAVGGILWMSEGTAPAFDEALSRAFRWSNAPVAVWRYLWHHVWCGQLGFYYPLPERPMWGAAAVAAVGLVGLVAGAWRVRKRWPWAAAGLAWFLVGLAPVLGIYRVGREVALADRYTYLPGLGVIVAVIFSLPTVAWRRTVWAGAGVALVVLGALGARQAWYWRDSLTLDERTLAVTGPRNFVALNSYAAALKQANRLGEARAAAEGALAVRPESFETRRLLGDILIAAGDVPGATVELERVVAAQGAYADGHISLGDARLKSGRFEEARREYGRAKDLDKSLAPAWGGLGDALVALGRPPEAAEAYSRSLELEPDNPHVLKNFGKLLMDAGRSDLALGQFVAAVRLDPRDAIGHNSLGAALANLGRMREAEVEFREAIRLDPGDESARRNLDMLRGMGRKSP